MLKLSKTSTFTLPVTVALPTDEANTRNEGTITVRYHLLPKRERDHLTQGEITDVEFFRRLVVAVEGLGDGEGQPITGEAALTEALEGPWSDHLRPAILLEYIEHFGQARVKNSKPSRGR